MGGLYTYLPTMSCWWVDERSMKKRLLRRNETVLSDESKAFNLLLLLLLCVSFRTGFD